MNNCTDEALLAECLLDPSVLALATCEHAQQLQTIALARIRELMCSCWTKPIAIGSGEGRTEFPSPIEAIDALRRVVQLTMAICAQDAELEGPVIETIYQDRCGRGVSYHCGPQTCTGATQRYHYR